MLGIGLDALKDFIMTLGFPIVAFFAIFYMTTKTIRDNTAALVGVKDSLVTLSLNVGRVVEEALRNQNHHAS